MVHSQSVSYQGQSAKLLRLWGRRRLALLKRVLPYTEKVRVSLLGQGMPSYWTLTGQGFSSDLCDNRVLAKPTGRNR